MLRVSGGSYVYAQLKSEVLSLTYDNVMMTKTDAGAMMMRMTEGIVYMQFYVSFFKAA